MTQKYSSKRLKIRPQPDDVSSANFVPRRFQDVTLNPESYIAMELTTNVFSTDWV